METTAIRTGYKQTKLGLIPEGWEFIALENGVAKTAFGPRFSSDLYSESGNVATLRTTDMDNDGNISLESMPMAILENEKMQRHFLREGDLVISRSGTIGITGVFTNWHKPVIAGAFLIRIELKQDKLHYSYTQYFLNSELGRREVKKIAGGGVQQNLQGSALLKLKVPFPPLPEQKAIAQCLGTWDRGIRLLTELVEQKELQKKGLMQQLLTGKKRLEGFSGEWGEVRLGDIASRVTRRNEELNDNVVTISAKRGFVRQEDFFNKRVASNTLSNYYLLYRGEFAYNKSYSNGYPMGAFKRLDSFDKAVVTTLYVCFKVNEETDADFIKYYFEGGRMIQGLMKIAHEGGRAHGLLNVGINDFLSLKLLLPEQKEQTAIAQVLQSADKEIQLLQAKLDLLKEQKKGLMQQLLMGKKRLGVEG